MKKGISLVSLTIVIIVMVILVGIVVIAGFDSTESVTINAFAVEILNIQNIVDEYHYRYEKYPSGADYTLDTTTIPASFISQFDEETITDNTITFKVVDLSLIGINDTKFGKGEGTDIYVLSEATGKVYYIQGVSYKGITYYTLTGDLHTLTYTNNSNGLAFTSDIKVYDVIFTPSNIEYTNQPVTVQIKLPIDATYNSVTVTESKSVSEATTSGGYNVITVNETSTDRNGNYTIDVNYTYNGTTKTATYAVTNFDNIAPTLNITEEKQTNLITVKIMSEETGSGIKTLKYEIGDITDESYFENYGKVVKNNQFVVDITDYYTIYIEDHASNKNIITTGWIQDGLTVRRGEQVLQVGDFIDYDAKVDTYTSTWQVLGAKNGELLIMSTEDIETGYELHSYVDCIRGVSKLNTLCQAYGKGKGAVGARSITAEDINKATGYNPKTAADEIGQLHEYGSEVTYWWTGNEDPYYTSTNGYKGDMEPGYHSGRFGYISGTEYVISTAPENATQLAPVKITTLTLGGYTYYGNTLTSNPEDGEKGLASDSKPYIMLFRNSENTSYSNYWLASSYATTDTSLALFGMLYVDGGKVDGIPIASSQSYNSISYYRGVRAVVSLGSNVILNGSSNYGWKME